MYCPEIGSKHQRTHNIKAEIRAHLTRVPLLTPPAIFRLDSLTETLNDVNHARLISLQRLGRESRAHPSSPNTVHFAICLSEAAVRPGGDVEGLVPLGFLDIGGSWAIDCAQGRCCVEGEGVGCDADDWAFKVSSASCAAGM
jgi:hypothetical protein